MGSSTEMTTAPVTAGAGSSGGGSSSTATGSGSGSASRAAPAVQEPAPLMSRRKLEDLLHQIDPDEKLDPAVEQCLLEIADDFVQNVATFSAKLAKHRKSKTIESQDVALHLERNWNIKIPGITRDD